MRWIWFSLSVKTCIVLQNVAILLRKDDPSDDPDIWEMNNVMRELNMLHLFK